MIEFWFFLVGAVLIVMAFAGHTVQRLPLSSAIIYLIVGYTIGPAGFGLLRAHPVEDAAVLEVLTEIAVLITLFAVGLRLRAPLTWKEWHLPLRLASLGMVATIVIVTAVGALLLDLPWGVALLLAAILAPTDPVLAADVQIQEPGDRDAVRFTLTAEGGMNDGAAFPGIMLGLGLIGMHEIGSAGWRWIAFDLVWAIAGGVLLGWLCGTLVARGVRLLRARGHHLEFEEFLVLGVIALSYGLALLLKTYGFLAVFAAGLAMNHIENHGSDGERRLNARLLSFSEQCERLAEVAVVLLIGAMLPWISWSWLVVALTGTILLIARPVAAWLTLPHHHVRASQRRLISWFGIRGVGSVYYLSFALDEHLPAEVAGVLVSVTLATITISIVLHGISATPLMSRYEARARSRT
ncbi:sodium/proton antiporter, CPA1 family (TC 2.A.36) [Gulbenkiania indica]|uniref:Sodium/proton antiporter, CPA1 family (TC 2.A.36) n=2 Tax=Gulbenkiania TaxID=397456 RepID=A0A0K6GUI8_9NEIS|nr:sodium:proton antiporter [Gulbenkiania indica]TCW33834.1 NhaP-type Na+/H+ or K+/H+ antiporter [Gulbenkiania mobilis]CUA82204.1 sodium/proton antiporter, CPA1 family (TC 2.A.36) [Gulbenkiania indica]